MKYKLFLDDFRLPPNCSSYMHTRIGKDNIIYTEPYTEYPKLTFNEGWWICVKNYDEFKECIQKHGVPYLVSYDHDLSDEHYNVEAMDDEAKQRIQFTEKTGLDCAKWLIWWCRENRIKHPSVIVHSMNPVGRKNIENLYK